MTKEFSISIFIFSILLFGCDIKNHSKDAKQYPYLAIDSVKINNGDDKIVKVAYAIEKWNYSEILKNADSLKFNTMIQKTRIDAMSNCKFVLTYEPKSFKIYIKDDRINIEHKYSAKSAMGVPGLLFSTSFFQRNCDFIRTDFHGEQ